jgi:hypothetical protein
MDMILYSFLLAMGLLCVGGALDTTRDMECEHFILAALVPALKVTERLRLIALEYVVFGADFLLANGTELVVPLGQITTLSMTHGSVETGQVSVESVRATDVVSKVEGR